MKFFNSRKTAVASLALLGLMAWSAEAASDNPCKGKDCPAAKTAKVPAPPAESKPNKDAAAVKLAPSGDGSVRNGSAKATKLSAPPEASKVNKDAAAFKIAPAGDGSVRKQVTAGDGSVRLKNVPATPQVPALLPGK